MKRSDMILDIANHLIREELGFPAFDVAQQEAEQLLNYLESKGMKPPALDEDKCQALMSMYYAGYTFYQWDEDFEKDEKLMEALERRERVKSARKQKFKEASKDVMKKHANVFKKLKESGD